MDKLRLSASAIRTFKLCPLEYYYKYILGIRKIEKPEALRMGSNWHALLEILNTGGGGVCPRCREEKEFDCPLCGTTGKLPDNIWDAIVAELDHAYETIPMGVEQSDWLVEREILLQSVLAYKNLYKDDETIATEVPFKLPFIAPDGKPIMDAILIGKLDRINGDAKLVESKSTASDLSGDSQFWDSLQLDTQTLLYLSTIQRLQKEGKLSTYGIKPTDKLINETIYDVWRKPGIKAKNLTQAASKKFAATGEYMGKKFGVVLAPEEQGGNFYVNEVPAEVTPGAKEGTFAIRETPGMFGARLADDIVKDPDKYFVRKPVPRTNSDILAFDLELYRIYKTIKAMVKDDLWYRNEHQCRQMGKCDYINECYNQRRLTRDNSPDEFELIF